MKKWPIPVYSTQLVRRRGFTVAEKPLLQNPQSVADLLWRFLKNADREKVVVILMDTQNRMIGMLTAFEGTLDSCTVHVREVIKASIIGQASSIIIGHNHPSGFVRPSQNDHELTKRLQEACAAVDVKLLDHVIVGEEGHFSFREEGVIKDL